jgi:RNA polymerase sigma-H factor
VGLAYSIAADYFMAGAELDDIRQAALVALLVAVRAYRTDTVTAVPFVAFATFVVRRKVIDAAKGASRGRHDVLTHSARHTLNEDGEEVQLVDLEPADTGDPYLELVARVRTRELLEQVKRALPRMSELERGVMAGRITGTPLKQLAARYGRSVKTIDNAQQRVRAKIEQAA